MEAPYFPFERIKAVFFHNIRISGQKAAMANACCCDGYCMLLRWPSQHYLLCYALCCKIRKNMTEKTKIAYLA